MSDHDDIVKLKRDMTWVKPLILAILGSIWLTHFLDPIWHWGLLQFP